MFSNILPKGLHSDNLNCTLFQWEMVCVLKKVVSLHRKNGNAMTNEEKVQHCINLSDEDLRAGATLFQGGHYLYVGFMCHQVIEKIFKAAYAKLKEDTPPFIHNLVVLAEKSGFDHELSGEQKRFIAALNPLNIEARYTEYKSKIAQQLTPSRCTEILEQTKILQLWIKEKILLRK
jgi:HEPN domain-containing protein